MHCCGLGRGESKIRNRLLSATFIACFIQGLNYIPYDEEQKFGIDSALKSGCVLKRAGIKFASCIWINESVNRFCLLAVLQQVPELLGWRPPLVGWRPSLLGWRPLLLEWRPSLLGSSPLLFASHCYWVGGHVSNSRGSQRRSFTRRDRRTTRASAIAGYVACGCAAFGALAKTGLSGQ